MWKKVISYTLLIAGSIFMLLPFVWTFTSSLKSPEQVFIFPPQWIPDPVQWSNYAKAAAKVPLIRFAFNSLFISTTLMIIQVFTSALAAYAFARLRFKGRDLLFMLYLGTMMVPWQVTIIPRFLVVRNLHLIDTYLGMMMPMFIYVLGTFIMRQYFLTLPYELEDAARIDGCSRIQTFWHIILPLSKPALATVAIFSFKNTWNEFIWPLVTLNTTEKYPIQVGLAFFRGMIYTEWELLLAGTVIAMLPLIVIFFIGQRYFVRGISLTGMGGR